jgi:hypothetical protein
MQARELLKSNTGARAKGQDDLFATEGHSRSVGAGVLTGTRKTTSPDELWGEYAALGFLRNAHLLALWKDKLAAFKRIKAIWLPQCRKQRKTYRLADYAKRSMDQGRAYHVLFKF